MSRFKKAFIYLNVFTVIFLAGAIIYSVWFDQLEDVFWKILGTYLTLVASCWIVIKLLEYIDKRDEA